MPETETRLLHPMLIIATAVAIFLGCIYSPPHLMDDVDAVQAQISRNMLESGDWVTARLNGVAYLEKAPLIYWLSALSYTVFGVKDWAGRLPLAMAVIGLCWITSSFGNWAFGRKAGFYSGLVLTTSVGLFLFTRIIIPDAILTLTITGAMWSFLRGLDEAETHPERWTILLGVCLGLGLLLKGLIGVLFPLGTALIFLTVTRQLFKSQTWRRLRPILVVLVTLAVAVPWHVLATLRNPPLFDFTMQSGPGRYRGFFWFYFINEHVLRFLNLRYPRDYNTVPRLAFWLFHLIWLFPWSLYGGAILKLDFRPADRSGQTRLLALCWIGVVLVFFTFSTTQEYYSMPAYPAFALLLGSAMCVKTAWVNRGTKAIGAMAILAIVVITGILWKVWTLPALGDISVALVQHPEMYTLSLGHMGDLTLQSFAYLRLPLVLAGCAALIGCLGITFLRQPIFAVALMMVVFFHAARVAMISFDPYLGSKALADTLTSSPAGKLIEADAYYTFSSVFFYTNRSALLWNGRVENLEYGSYAPDAARVFIGDEEFQRLWCGGDRYYLLALEKDLPRVRELAGETSLIIVKESGGKYLLTNQPLIGDIR